MSNPMSVTEPFERAIAYTRRILFQPFLFSRWLSFGVIIFLETLVQGSGGMGFRVPGSGSSGTGKPDPGISEVINRATEWTVSHLGILLPLGALVLTLVLGFVVLVTWLGSRGQIMFIRAVAMEDTSIGENWHGARQVAGSLFRFRIVLTGVALFITAIGLVYAGVVAVGLAAQGTDSFWTYAAAMIPVLLVWIPFAMVVWLVGLLLRNFVAPLMWLRPQPCLAAWREFREVSRGNVLAILLVLLLRAAYHVGFGVLSLLIGCMTCCLGFLPVLHQTLFAPFYVFDRAYTLGVLESLGPEYKFFTENGLYESAGEPPALP